MLALSGIATASASAAECPGTGEGLELCSGGHTLEGTFEFTGKAAGAKFKIESIGSYECAGIKSKGKFTTAPGKVEVTGQSMEWLSCHVNPTCQFHPLVFGGGAGLHGIWANKAGTDEITLSTVGTAPFGELLVTGCEQEMEGKITGAQKCKLPHATTEAATHEVVCEFSGSELQYKPGFRRFYMQVSEEVKLSSGKAFSLQQG
jgi:hypothetical protein